MATRKNSIDWPTSWGDKRVVCLRHVGPTSYTQVSNATPATGGDIITPGGTGLKSADFVFAPMASDNGQYIAQLIPINGNSDSTFGVQPSTSWTIRWLTASTGAEAAGTTNLASRNIMLVFVGPK